MMNPDRCSNGNGSSHSFFFSFSPSHLLERLYLLGIVVAFEYIFCFGGRVPLPEHLKIHGMVSDVYGQIPIFAYAVFLGFGHSRLKAQKEDVPFNRIFFWAHFLCIAAVLSFTLVKQQGVNSLSFDPFGYIKSAIYLLGTVLLVLACIPLHSWIVAVRATGRLWLYASLTGIAGWYLGTPVKLLWKATSTVQSGIAQRSTLYAVSAILGRFLPDMIVEPATFTIGSPRYLLVIAPGCSGVEGLGLVLLFTSIWLWYFKKEICFPQCFLLIPCALGCSWLLNIGRLCGLILIASAGFPEIAMAGFHIAAGWISFIIVALVFSLAMQKISWFQRIPSSASCMAGSSSGGHVELCAGSVEKSSEHRGESPEIRAYLVPFLAILAATFVSKAASGYFEWLYPLRFIAAAVALFYFWPELKKLDWRFSWAGPVAGVAVFLVWMAPTWRAGHFAASPIGPALAALSPTARWTWITFRVAAAVITVPIAEELAFRGYLARRLISWDFSSVSFTSLSAFSIALSSAVFGLMHGQQWMVGILAGLAYALALRWRGRMGDAVLAHAVSNLLLAVWVLSYGDWALW